LDEPTSFLNGLFIHELEQLLLDVNKFLAREENNASGEQSYHYDAHTRYWQDVKVIAQDELRKLSGKINRVNRDRRNELESVYPVVIVQNGNGTELYKNKNDATIGTMGRTNQVIKYICLG
jgi:hypothetical protein